MEDRTETRTVPSRIGDTPGVNDSSDLNKRIGLRDREAFSECVSRYGPFIWSLAKLFTLSRDEAENVTEEIFANILRHREPGLRRSCDKEIIVEIAHKHILGYIKQKRSDARISNGPARQHRGTRAS